MSLFTPRAPHLYSKPGTKILLLETFLWSGDRGIGVQVGGEGGTFEPVNPVIVDVSFRQWLCLQFPIYDGSRGLPGCPRGRCPCGQRWARAASPAAGSGAGGRHGSRAPGTRGTAPPPAHYADSAGSNIWQAKANLMLVFYVFHSLQTTQHNISIFRRVSLSLPLPLQASPSAAAGAAALAPSALLPAGMDTQEGLVIRMAMMRFTLASSVYKEGCFPQLLYF